MARSPRQRRQAQRARAKAKAARQAARRSAPRPASRPSRPSRSAPRRSSGSRSSSRSASRSSGGSRNRGTTMRNPGNGGRASSASVRNAGRNINNNRSSSSSGGSRQTVAQRREAAARAGVSMRNYKQGLAAGHYTNRGRLTQSGRAAIGSNRSFTNAQMAGNAGGARGLVRARREAAKASGLSMKAYKAGVSSGVINKHGKVTGAVGGNDATFNSNYQNFLNNFSQEEMDNYAKRFENGRDPNFGATLGPNGLHFDANYSVSLPQGMDKFGFKAGDMLFDPSRMKIHDENLHMAGKNMGAELTGRIAYMKADGTPMFETTGSGTNPNWDKYAKAGSERMSSKGLYQDRYNVGYHGEDDLGDEYASNASHGSIASYFKDYNSGKKSFGQAYTSFVGTDRKDGYAGDVLKLIDSGRMKVTDDQYNMIVTDAKNYDWGNRKKIAGRDAGQASYDSRVGGMSQASITANKNFYENRANGYHRAGAIDPRQDAAMYSQNQRNDNLPYSQGTAEQYQNNQENYVNQRYGTNPYNNWGSNFKWTLDHGRFVQGQ